MKPSFKVFEQETWTDHLSAKILTPSQLLPKHIICPRGTVIVKRMQEKELAMEKSSPLLGMVVSSSSDAFPNIASGHQVSNYFTDGYNTRFVM